MRVGPVRYARNGSVRLAYRIIGDADIPLVLVPGWVSSVDAYDDPSSPFADLAAQLAASTRYVVWDKRGTGLSDPVAGPPALDERMDDLRAVMDAAEVGDANLLGMSEGGPMCLLFAATYPERVRSMVLLGTAARFSRDAPSFPWGFTPAQIDAQLADIDERWADGALIELFLPSIAEVEGVAELWARNLRSSASPTMAGHLWRALMEIDARDVVGSIQSRTLVLHRRGDRVVPVEAALALADALPDAAFRELPPGDHLPVDIIDVIASEVLAFVVGEQRVTPVGERVLATVLFTDIVGSTEALSAQGDESWRRQLDAHDEVFSRHLTTFGGRKVNQAGDGVFAVFDGPTKAARCALDLVPALANRGIRIRAGVHIGECERRGDDWSGVSVHIGARVAAMAGAGEVLVSRTVRDLSGGSGLLFEDRGSHRLKGVPEQWQLFRVTSAGATA